MNVLSSTTPSVQSTQRLAATQSSRPQDNVQSQSQSQPTEPAPTASQNAPVINSQGQTTGRLLNVTA